MERWRQSHSVWPPLQGHSPSLQLPGLWRRAPPARAREGFGRDMLALGSNLSPENGTKTTHQGHLGQGLEGSHGSGGPE